MLIQNFTSVNINITTLKMLIMYFENSTFGVIMSLSGRVGSGRIRNLALGWVTENGHPWTSPLEIYSPFSGHQHNSICYCYLNKVQLKRAIFTVAILLQYFLTIIYVVCLD